jgi:hypothetical protein
MKERPSKSGTRCYGGAAALLRRGNDPQATSSAAPFLSFARLHRERDFGHMYPSAIEFRRVRYVSLRNLATLTRPERHNSDVAADVSLAALVTTQLNSRRWAGSVR